MRVSGSLRKPALWALLPLLLVTGSRILSSPDLGWHIRAGERIVSERAIPSTDDFSYTREGERWWVNQPLAEVLFYGVHERFGPAGLVVFRAAVILAIFLSLLATAGTRNETAAAAALLLALLASVSHFLVRPFLLSALFLALTGLAVERHRRRGDRGIYLLVPLFALWAQVHPGFLYGAGLLGAAMTGEWIRRRVPFLRGDRKPLTNEAIRRLWIGGGAAAGAALASGALLNPSGVSAVILPLGLMRTGYFFTVLNEFQPADLWRDRFFFALLSAAVLSVFPRRRRDATEILSIAIFALFAVRAVRVILPFAVVAAPIAARNLAGPADRFFADRRAMGRVLRYAASAGILILAAWWWRSDPNRFPLGASGPDSLWARVNYPIETYRFLREEELPGEVFHPDRYGGSFIWYFYPERKCFVDGRVEVYGEEFWRDEYFRVLACGPGWEERLRRYGVNTLLLRIGTPAGMDRIGAAIPESPAWAPVDFDDYVMVYVRRESIDPEHLARIEIDAVDPMRGPLPRSAAEERAAAEDLERMHRRSGAARPLFFLVRLWERREAWERIADLPDEDWETPGNPAIRAALRNARGEARFRLGRFDEAEADWKRAAGDPWASRNRSLIGALRRGSLDRYAVETPGRAAELGRAAGLLLDAGSEEEAARLLREAARLEPLFSAHRNALAWVLLERGADEAEALREAREAVRLDPRDGYARGTLARALGAAGDRAGAEREMRRAIELLPPEAYIMAARERGRLALFLRENGDESSLAEAALLAAEALRLDPETKERDQLSVLAGAL
ncbi:MAG: hypothetical protein JW958_07950 [Candidatus Eisenbacteria bacterium]|nr:hypothetical protein [Candidatus Eisenbacteria bacterium]